MSKKGTEQSGKGGIIVKKGRSNQGIIRDGALGIYVLMR